MDENSAAVVLIADDTPANLQLLTVIIREQGYTVRALRKGEMVLQSAVQSKPDIILLDIMMPDLDGYEVCRRLKEDERTKDIPVIFISALNAAIDKVKAFSAGGVDYITKPVQKEEVLARLKNHLDLNRLRRQLEFNNQWLQHEIQGRKKIEKALILDESRLKALLALTHMRNKSERELTDYALEECVRLTNSRIGYIHFVEDDQNSINLYTWSAEALKNCVIPESTHYALEKAGIWADCVRKKVPVIHKIGRASCRERVS
jgi:DNA-binding response OmpR family regulator